MKTDEKLFNPGDKAIVFDAKSWSKTGDIGDNSIFFKPAKVLKVRTSNRGEWLADVEFKDGTFSRGHFQSCMKPIKKNSEKVTAQRT